MDLRVLVVLAVVLAGVLAVPAGTGISRQEREAAFADYPPDTRERLVELSSGWGEGWQDLLLPGPKPQPRAVEDQVHFWLWTRSNPQIKYVLEPFDADSFAASNFDASKETQFTIHGFTVDGTTQWILDARDALLDRDDVNVISVDWGELAAAPDYIAAVSNVYVTAEYVASVLEWMATDVGLDFKKTNFAGHSLGGQMSGVLVDYLTSGSLARVTALDPAAPLFDDQDAGSRVNPDSADFVDVIHTNAGPLTDGCLGMYARIGQVDFYPNGGVHQPGCQIINSTNILDLVASCSHGRAPDYWIESIWAQEPADNTFWANPCEDYDTYSAGGCSSCGDGCLQMGYPDDISGVNIPSTVQYYLTTNSETPFAQGQA